MARVYKTLKELGVATWHPEKLALRRSNLSEVKSGELVGKRFMTTKGKIFTCEKIDKRNVYFNGIEMNRKYALFKLPTLKQLSTSELIEAIKQRYPGSRLYIPKTGCQMHGDIDATLRLVDGTVYTIPWNY